MHPRFHARGLAFLYTAIFLVAALVFPAAYLGSQGTLVVSFTVAGSLVTVLWLRLHIKRNGNCLVVRYPFATHRIPVREINSIGIGEGRALWYKTLQIEIRKESGEVELYKWIGWWGIWNFLLSDPPDDPPPRAQRLLTELRASMTD